jgi:hypothetical protein
VLHGAGGYGKTILVNYLCRDPDVRFEFSDGIVRVERLRGARFSAQAPSAFRRHIRDYSFYESPPPFRMRAGCGGATTLKPLHLDIENRDAFGRGAAQAARVPPNVDHDIIRVLAPMVPACHRHSSYAEANR